MFDDDEAYRYYVTNGHVPHLPLGNDALSYYSPHHQYHNTNNGSEASCYSGDEELESYGGRPSSTSPQHRYRLHSRLAFLGHKFSSKYAPAALLDADFGPPGRNQHPARRGTILFDCHPDVRLRVK